MVKVHETNLNNKEYMIRKGIVPGLIEQVIPEAISKPYIELIKLLDKYFSVDFRKINSWATYEAQTLAELKEQEANRLMFNLKEQLQTLLLADKVDFDLMIKLANKGKELQEIQNKEERVKNNIARNENKSDEQRENISEIIEEIKLKLKEINALDTNPTKKRIDGVELTERHESLILETVNYINNSPYLDVLDFEGKSIDFETYKEGYNAYFNLWKLSFKDAEEIANNIVKKYKNHELVEKIQRIFKIIKSAMTTYEEATQTSMPAIGLNPKIIDIVNSATILLNNDKVNNLEDFSFNTMLDTEYSHILEKLLGAMIEKNSQLNKSKSR